MVYVGVAQLKGYVKDTDQGLDDLHIDQGWTKLNAINEAIVPIIAQD